MGWRLRGRRKLWEVGDGCFFFCVVFFVWFYVMDLGVVGRCNSVALFFTCFALSLFLLSLTVQKRYG